MLNQTNAIHEPTDKREPVTLRFFDRDLSWISFNDRILVEAANQSLPLRERINFLAIFSSNLDEFYRVRMPALKLSGAIAPVYGATGIHQSPDTRLKEVNETINRQLKRFGHILNNELVPQLRQHGIHLVYHEPVPDTIQPAIQEYFFTQVLAFLQPVKLCPENSTFFPANNLLYFAVLVSGQQGNGHDTFIVNIPSDNLPRFVRFDDPDKAYIIFLDDIMRENLAHLFPGKQVLGAYSFKITRDAELDLQDEYEGDIAEKIEQQINIRDLGFATRMLYQPGMPLATLQQLVLHLHLHSAIVIEGGVYHHLKDLFGFPVTLPALLYPVWKTLPMSVTTGESIFSSIAEKDYLLHTPYQDYGMVLRFFNEAAVDTTVTEINVTLYRIAGDSKIGNALISAAKNGKKVTVFVELKARFDEANNLKWSKRMKAAGVKIIYSIPGLKVHAKVALVKRREGLRNRFYGLLSTGNFNEATARIYTDHILFTAQPGLVRELDLLFIFLAQRRHPDNKNEIRFHHLLVAQFNLLPRLHALIDREIAHARAGKAAGITIKLNNLEEQTLIRKLYAAAEAGVPVRLIVRSICCLVPGDTHNIMVTRIVDRYLEHSRVLIFNNNNNPEVWLGSADWMNRNIYRRIEVCFPVTDPQLITAIMHITGLQEADTLQAVALDSNMHNIPLQQPPEPVRSQEAIYNYCKQLHHNKNQ